MRLIPSLSTCSLPALSLDEFLSAANNAGYDYFEAFTTWTNARLGPDVVTPDQLASACAKHGVKLATLNIANLSAADHDSLPDNIERIAADMSYARKLGLDSVTLKGAGRDQPMQVFTEGAAQIAHRAEELGMHVRLGNHLGNRLMTSADYRELFDLTGNLRALKILADTRHLEFSGQSMVEFLREWGDRVTLIHINDRVGGQSVPLGTGEVDIPAVLATALEIGYSGYITVEIEVADAENTERYALEARKYLEEQISRLESII